ncbi:NAD(P)-binding protein [Alternaria alternata]|uniref:NAD(P)-binding protein n=1 Tax=Alternaria alternata TaxID=5599 RepID=A0A177DZH6_ALTAL|nr:NAD(P)-binding protein [Alternaria alternata]OAG24888.1 NAD(P)-binding protein [Alternaria alternata]
MSSLEHILASNALIGPDDVPKTAVFVGATDGIGKATLQTLVSKGFQMKIYIVGRNKASHQGLLEDLARNNPRVTLIFIEGQISLVADAQRIASQIAAQEDRVDLLFLSSGYLPFTGPQETPEGLEASQVVSYYSHVVFVLRLLQQLRRASVRRPARVLNILAAGEESMDLYLDDLTLKKPEHFNVPAYAKHAATSVTLTLKRIAEEKENSNIVFIHAHPGMVSTKIFQKSWGDKYDPDTAHFPMPTRHIFQCTPEQAGERCLYLATSAEYGGVGVALQHGRQEARTMAHVSKHSLFAISDRMEYLQPDELLAELQKLGAPEVIWAHTMDVLETHGGVD